MDLQDSLTDEVLAEISAEATENALDFSPLQDQLNNNPSLRLIWERMEELRRVMQLFPQPQDHKPTMQAECMLLDLQNKNFSDLLAPTLYSPRSGLHYIPFDYFLLVQAVKGEIANNSEEHRKLIIMIVFLDTNQFVSHMTNAVAEAGGENAKTTKSDLELSGDKKDYFRNENKEKYRSTSVASLGGLFNLKKKMNLFPITVSKYYLDFRIHNAMVPLNCEMIDDIRAKSKDKSCKFQFLPVEQYKSSYSISIIPETGVIKKKQEIEITVRLVVHSCLVLETVLCMELETGARFYFLIKIQSEFSVFGVDMASQVDVDHPIPEVLVLLRRELIQQGGLEKQGIFQHTGDEEEILEIKDQLNRNTFQTCKNVLNIAALIKQYFRELPRSLLQGIAVKELQEAQDDATKFSDIIASQSKPYSDVTFWLIDLLAEVAQKESVNGMSIDMLATIMAPNLFKAEDAGDVRSVAAEITHSQHISNLLSTLTQKRLQAL